MAAFLVKSLFRPKTAKIEPPANVSRSGIKVIVTGLVESPPHCMKAKDVEQRFDEGIDLTASLDLSKVRRVLQEQKRVNVDFPTWMIDSLDREASKLGVTRQSVIKVWLAERLETTGSNLSLKRTRGGIAHR